MNSNPKYDIIFVDDERNILDSLERVFRKNRLKILATSDPHRALEAAALGAKLIISDQRMPSMKGVELLSKVRDMDPRAYRILLTGHADIEAVEDAINKSAVTRYLNKPWKSEDLREIALELLVRYDSDRSEEQRVDTLEKRMEELEHACSLAESKALNYKTNASTVAHDLRNPLIAIRFGLQLLKDTLNEEESDRNQYLDTTLDCIERLHKLTSQIVDKEIDSQADQSPDSSDLSKLATEVMETETPTAEKKGINIEVDIEEDCSCSLSQLEAFRLLYNLVGNAIKYTETGTVTIRANNQEKETLISVSDTGTGMTPEEAERIFSSGSRLERHSNTEGAGIGLSICQKIATEAGGRIWVESAPGEGSQFHVALPNPRGKTRV